MPDHVVSAVAALEQVTAQPAWAVIRLRDSETVTLVGGPLVEADRLADIPLAEGAPEPGRRFDTLVAVPFRQVAERGFEVHDDGTSLAVVRLDTEVEVPLDDLVAALPDEPVEFADRGGFETSD
jgi:phenazine biosynthesis protein phzE